MMTPHVRAHWRRAPADSQRLTSGQAWQLVVALPDGSTKVGPAVFTAAKPSRVDTERILRRLMRHRYWRVSELRRAA